LNQLSQNQYRITNYLNRIMSSMDSMQFKWRWIESRFDLTIIELERVKFLSAFGSNSALSHLTAKKRQRYRQRS